MERNELHIFVDQVNKLLMQQDYYLMHRAKQPNLVAPTKTAKLIDEILSSITNDNIPTYYDWCYRFFHSLIKLRQMQNYVAEYKLLPKIAELEIMEEKFRKGLDHVKTHHPEIIKERTKEELLNDY